jgi:MFS family permease
MNETDPADTRPHDPYGALRRPGFRLFLIGWMVALLGSQIQSVAIGWQLFNRTGDTLVLGWVGLAQALPVILLAIPAGQLSDRWSRRHIVISAMIVAACCSAGLALLSGYTGPVWAYYVVLATGATANAIGWPARAALVPQLVATEQVANAITWTSSAFQLACIVGPGIGGFIVAHSATAGYALTGLCELTFAGLLAFVALRPAGQTREPISKKTLIAGVRFVHQQKPILATITLDLVAVLLGGATYLLPVFAKDILQVGPKEFGWLRAAPAVGSLVMAMALTHLPPAKHAGRAMLWAVAGFGVATVVFGLSRNLWLSLAMLFLTGLFDNISVVVRHTLVQVLTPDEMRGRVSAVNTVFIGASNELGGFESGLTAKLFGPVWSVVGGGLGAVLATAWTAWQWPQLRALGALHEVKPAATAPTKETAPSGNAG